jgi:hypothetical protein
VRTIPGTLVSDEPYTITREQIAALNCMPPGVYLVCGQCGKFQPASTTINFIDANIICEMCAKGVRV